MPNGIRNEYETHGVEGYYREQGGDYRNPHFPQIRELLISNEGRIDYSQALDFCCGSGEVSLVLKELGYNNTEASDPYTQAAFQERLGRPCRSWSFDEVIRGQLEGQYTAIISSFALHLCPEKQVFSLAYQLLLHAPQLVVITPHKRPVLERFDGIELGFADVALTERGKRVFLKIYRFGG